MYGPALQPAPLDVSMAYVNVNVFNPRLLPVSLPKTIRRAELLDVGLDGATAKGTISIDAIGYQAIICVVLSDKISRPRALTRVVAASC